MSKRVHTDYDEDDNFTLQRCVNGDIEAFSILVEKYQSILFNLIYRMLYDRDDAADVLQNVFLKAYEKICLYKPGKQFFPWIRKIAVNESINFIHHRDRMTHLIEERFISVDDTPDILLQKADEVHFIERALLKVKIEDRILITLRHFGNLSYGEISEILGVSEKTVKSRLYSARQELRKLLKNINN